MGFILKIDNKVKSRRVSKDGSKTGIFETNEMGKKSMIVSSWIAMDLTF